MKKKMSNDINKLIWELDEPVVTPLLVPLTRESIVRSAIEIADKEGLTSVSFRKIGTYMGAGHMRLYTYFSSKEELLELMVDTFFAEIVENKTPNCDWRSAIKSISNRIRKVSLSHPWVIDILGTHPDHSPNALIYIEENLSILYQVSESKEIYPIFLTGMTLKSYVIGFIRNELSELRAAAESGLDRQDWQIRTESYMTRMMSTGRFPTLEKVIEVAKDYSLDTEFIKGLDCLLDGIERQLLNIKKDKT